MAYRQKTQARFQEEVQRTVDTYGARFLFMTDNILSMDYYDQFMDWAAQTDTRVNYFFEIKANLRREHVAKLARAGITAVQPGIESLSTATLALMRKGTTGIQNIAFLKYAREYGIYCAYNLLVGFPNEDPAEYDRLASLLPQLMHLAPPTGAPRIEYHRFSPYHGDPSAFGLELKPSHFYRALYPLPEAELSRIAYVFEDAKQTPELPYLNSLAKQLRRWVRAYNPDDCPLTWRPGDDGLVVDDRRPDFPDRRYWLREYAAVVFAALDRPRLLKSLVADATTAPDEEDGAANLLNVIFGLTGTDSDDRTEVIAFDREAFLADPRGSLGPLVAAGLVYVEGDHYLALPVREHPQAPSAEWLRLGV
jgi:ribosomal peptide maturation radical SAM protein 1